MSIIGAHSPFSVTLLYQDYICQPVVTMLFSSTPLVDLSRVFYLPNPFNIALCLSLALPDVRRLVWDLSHHLGIYDGPRPFG